MGIGRRIKEAREIQGLTQIELGKMVGVTGSAITNYENETSHPKEPVMYRLIEALKIDANYLFQDCVRLPKESNDVTLSEYRHIEKYRALDDYGRETVDITLDRETQRTLSLKTLSDQVDQIREELSDTKTRYFSYYGKIAAAGKSFGFDDILAADVMELPVTDQNQDADYLIGVSGDSMEPTYSDGDIVYVKKIDNLDVGQIGIFQKDNGIYIKEVGESGLISHNPAYRPMINGGNVICLGKVIGKVEE